jgi:hypothetical protein
MILNQVSPLSMYVFVHPVTQSSPLAIFEDHLRTAFCYAGKSPFHLSMAFLVSSSNKEPVVIIAKIHLVATTWQRHYFTHVSHHRTLPLPDRLTVIVLLGPAWSINWGTCARLRLIARAHGVMF